MKYLNIVGALLILSSVSNEARSYYRGERSYGIRDCAPSGCAPCFLAGCCNAAPYCGPFPRPLPGDYASFKDNTRIQFWKLPPCAPRNASAARGYLYNGMWWDKQGVRYWAIRNTTDNLITIEALAGGDIKDIPAGDVANIIRGESYSFRVQTPARRFELFNSNDHELEIFVNKFGDLDYRAEPKVSQAAKGADKQLIMPKF